MKTILLAVLQALLFYVVFLVGSLWDPFHMKWWVHPLSPTVTRYFVPDGLILAAALYLLILAAEAARKRLLPSGLVTTAAFVAAVALGALSKFGMVTHDLLG
jgi:hypothetical protein